MSYNRIILLGNMTRDPELSYLPNQTAVVKFGLAMNHKWKKADGGQGEDVCFVDCVMFGKRAEAFNKYHKKGSAVLVEGRLSFDTWQAQDGTKRSKHKVSVDSFTFVGQSQSEAGRTREPGEDVPY